MAMALNSKRACAMEQAAMFVVSCNIEVNLFATQTDPLHPVLLMLHSIHFHSNCCHHW